MIGDYAIAEYRAPANMTNDTAVSVDTNALLFLGQITHGALGIEYTGPKEVIRYDVSPQQWDSLMDGYPQSTSREALPVLGGGLVPIIFVPTDIAAPGDQTSRGEQWELTCLERGWWSADPTPDDFPSGHIYDLSYMPAGPEAGDVFSAPDWFLFAGLFAALYLGGVNQ